jgi:fumarate reductase subunit D
MAKSNEPIWWSLFSAGGVVAALLMPIHILLTGIAWPLGLLPPETMDYSRWQSLLGNPLIRLYCFVLISLPLFHWAHRFRYALMDLGVHGGRMLLAVLFYGGAIAGTIAAVVVLFG